MVMKGQEMTAPVPTCIAKDKDLSLMSTHLRATRTLPTLLVLPRMERMAMAATQYMNWVLQPGTSHQPSLASVTGSPANFSQASCRTDCDGGWEKLVSLSLTIQS